MNSFATVPVVNDFGTSAPNATAERAFQIQLVRAARHGQVLSTHHRETLRALHYCYAYTALGITPGRVAWPLPVGAGKTQSVVAFAAASCERARPFTMLVCMNRVEALAKLQRDMIEAGVPPEKVGLLHTHRFDARHAEACRRHAGPAGFASAPSIAEADAGTYPILLVTHRMLQSRLDQFAFGHIGDAERDLIVWDESLLKAAGSHLDLLLVREARAVAKERLRELRKSSDVRLMAHGAVTYFDLCISMLDEELQRQRGGEPPHLVSCPDITGDQLAGFEAALRELLCGGPVWLRRPELLDTAEAFLRNVREPVRVVELTEQNNRRRGLIEFRPLIPDSLRRVVVLDASHVVRKLVQLDRSIRTAPIERPVKSFAPLVVSQLRHGGGRATVDAALTKSDSKLLREIVERVKGYPADEAILIFTHRARDDDRKAHAEILQGAFEAAGIDTRATLLDGRPRFVWLTWGNETGISDFSYCTRVLCVGVYRRSKLDLAAQIAGQVGALEATEAGHEETVAEVLLSEIFHALLQAAGRGACRDTLDGQCRPMALDWIGIEDFPEQWWRDALPGCQLTAWEPLVLTRRVREADAVKAMRAFLERQPPSVDCVSCKTLKLGAGLAAMRPDTFSKHRNTLLAQGLKGWRYEGRSFVRLPEFEFAPA